MDRKKPTTGGKLARREPSKPAPTTVVPKKLIDDLRKMIDESRQAVAQTVNTALVWLYWNVGKRIRVDILKQKRAEYGAQIVSSLSRQLTAEYGKGFSRQNLFRMIQFAEAFPDKEIVSSLVRQLSWTHFIYLLPLDDPLKRDFYAEMCRVERWSVRTLKKKINGMLFERTALSKKPEKLARQELAALRDEDRLTPDLVFRDPYFLDFLGLKDTNAEKDLEAAILRELESFILELGVGFAFVARQKRITVDDQDYYLDLLFYHRGLRRLIAIDLHPVRYDHDFISLRLRSSQSKRWQQLRWLYQRSEAAHPRTSGWRSAIDETPTTAGTHLLRSLPESVRRHEARKVSEVGVGKALPQEQTGGLSHVVKLGRFQAADKGQMELYLRWLEEHEQQPGEESPLGLILCAGKSDEHVKLLRLSESGIRVAAYLTELPPRKLLEKKLHEAVRKARAQLGARGKDRETS